jgi:methyltransferase (TIGR00027 family)
LRFVEADLSRESLAAVLAGAGYAAELPGFFNWLGVTYYLTPEAVLATLGAIAAIAAPGSRVVLDYREAPAGQAPARPGRAGLVRARLERLGEAVLSQFVPAELAASLTGLGLRVVEDLAPAEIQARYFAGRADGYQAHGQCRFLCAEVA